MTARDIDRAARCPAAQDLTTHEGGGAHPRVSLAADRVLDATVESEDGDTCRHRDISEQVVRMAPELEEAACLAEGARDLIHDPARRTRDPLLGWLESLPAQVHVVLDPGAIFAELEEPVRRRALALTDVWTSNEIGRAHV